MQACHPLPGGGLFLLPFGKKSGPNCPLDGFRQFEKLFIHAFHFFSGLIHPGGALGSGRFCGAARQGVRRRVRTPDFSSAGECSGKSLPTFRHSARRSPPAMEDAGSAPDKKRRKNLQVRPNVRIFANNILCMDEKKDYTATHVNRNFPDPT